MIKQFDHMEFKKGDKTTKKVFKNGKTEFYNKNG